MSKNSIIGRMFANATAASADNDTTLTASSSRSASPCLTLKNNAKRNLFGIRLNHEQLKQDLKDMWSDQVERQKQMWNFDFEHLKPLDQSSVSNSSNVNTDENTTRFQWSQMSTKCNQFYGEKDASSHTLATFNKSELNDTEDYETEEEEDDALVVPMFYKYQRRAKMNDEQNRLKIIQLGSSSSSSNAFTKLNNSGKSIVSTKKRVTRSNNKNMNANNNIGGSKKLHKPQARRPSLTMSVQSNLIITFSENRKDTLRSAAGLDAGKSKQLADLFVSTSKTIEENGSSSSAFKPATMKQQSLLDMLKHRKRKTSVNGTGSAKSMAKQVGGLEAVSHNLRPRTTSMN